MDNMTSIKVPKKYEDRISLIYHDSDGYRCILNRGWFWDVYGLHVIHVYTQKELLFCIKETQPCDCLYCRGLED